MKYVILKIGGSQYLVSEGDKFLVDKLNSDKPDYKLLMVNDNGKIEIGKPYINKKLQIKITSELVKGEKIYPSKYKSKSRYRRRIGFRPQYSEVLLEKI